MIGKSRIHYSSAQNKTFYDFPTSAFWMLELWDKAKMFGLLLIRNYYIERIIKEWKTQKDKHLK